MSSPRTISFPPLEVVGEQLLPCPFCGVAPVLRDSGIGSYQVECENRECAARPGVNGFAISRDKPAPLAEEARS